LYLQQRKHKKIRPAGKMVAAPGSQEFQVLFQYINKTLRCIAIEG